jgi:hypothetical protein
MQYGAPPPQAPPPAPPTKKKGKGGLIALLGVLVVLAIAATVFFVLRGGGDDDEVVLQPVTAVGEDPWTDNFDLFNGDLERLEIALDGIPELDDATDDTGIPVDGDLAGLFGGVRGEVACDKDGLAEQLTDDDAKAEEFATVQGISAGDVEDFVGDLTAVMLRKDTRLGDHGFRDGSAERFESVLEKGTAVLVDGDGVPRVRCASGSPLVAAGAVSGELKFRGAQWPGFDKDRVIVVSGSDVGDAFVLVDNDTDDVFVRPVGSAGDEDDDASTDVACALNVDSETCLSGGDVGDEAGGPTTTEPELGTGDIQFTLRWASTADIDMAVTDPTGERVDFLTDSVSSGGRLDIDANGNCNELDDTPVENIFWPPGTAPIGTYTVEIDYFSECDGGAGPQDFELTVVVGGDTQVETGTLDPDAESLTFTFTL